MKTMDHEQAQMLRKYPLLLPKNTDYCEYEGYFSAGNEEHRLHVSLPNAPELTDMHFIDCSWDLRLILQEYEHEVEQWKSSSSSFFKFMEWIQNTISSDCGKKQTESMQSSSTIPVQMWHSLFQELGQLGFNKVSKADCDKLSWVDLTVTDAADRDHALRVKLSEDHPMTFTANLPEQSLKLVQAKTSIVEAYHTFESQVSILQTFWNCMEEIDLQCWVMDPVCPSTADTKRQIALESDVSLVINVDPFHPLDQPDLKLLGPQVKVEPLQMRLASSEEWLLADGDSLYSKLVSRLGIKLPSQPAEQKLSQLSQDEMCRICLMSEMMDQRCDACNSVYHLNCLKEWLTSVPNAVSTFNSISGKCPMCQAPIFCVF